MQLYKPACIPSLCLGDVNRPTQHILTNALKLKCMSHLADVVRWVLRVIAVNATLQNHNSWALAIHKGVVCPAQCYIKDEDLSSATGLQGRRPS